MVNSSSEVNTFGREDFPTSLLVFKAQESAVLAFCSWLDMEIFPEPDFDIMLLLWPLDFFPKDENLRVLVAAAPS